MLNKLAEAKVQTYVFRAVIVAAIFYLVIAVDSIIMPIALSIIICFIMQPVVDWLNNGRLFSKCWHMPRSLAILITFLIFAVIVGAILASVMLPVAGQAYSLTENLPLIISKVQNFWQETLLKFNDANIPDAVKQIIQKVFAGLASLSFDLSGRIFSATINFATRVVELFIVPLLAYYLLKDGRNLVNGVIGLFDIKSQPKVRALTDELGRVLSGYLLGQATVCLLMGIVVAIGLTWIGLPYALVLGVLAALTEAIPVIGSIIGSVPALLIALLFSPATAVKVLVFYIVIFKIDSNIIVPHIVGKRIKLHPMLIILCLLVGAQLNGIIGMIAAVPVTAITVVLIKHLWQWNVGRHTGS